MELAGLSARGLRRGRGEHMGPADDGGGRGPQLLGGYSRANGDAHLLRLHRTARRQIPGSPEPVSHFFSGVGSSDFIKTRD